MKLKMQLLTASQVKYFSSNNSQAPELFSKNNEFTPD
jgi:hypothetical protein